MSQELIAAARKLWGAHKVYVSGGATSANYDRHVWPVIKEIQDALRALEPRDEAREGFAAGFRDSDNPDSYGMYAGITQTIEEIEEFEPYYQPGQPRRRCFIFYFDGKGGQHIVAEWKQDRWIPSDGA